MEKKTRVPADCRKVERFTHFSILKFLRAFFNEASGKQTSIATRIEITAEFAFPPTEEGSNRSGLGSGSRILPPGIFTIRMRIEANHLIALRQLTLSDENVSSPILLLRVSTHTHTHISFSLHSVRLRPFRQTTKIQLQFRQVIDIIRLLDTRCIHVEYA